MELTVNMGQSNVLVVFKANEYRVELTVDMGESKVLVVTEANANRLELTGDLGKSEVLVVTEGNVNSGNRGERRKNTAGVKNFLPGELENENFKT